MNIVLEINSTPVPYDKLTGYEVGTQDIDADTSGRNKLTAEMHRDRVAIKKTVNATLSYLTIAEMSSLMKSMTSIYFPVKYFDTDENAVLTKTFYVGDRVKKFVEGSEIYEPITLQLTEV